MIKKKYKYLRMCNSSCLEAEKQLLKGFRYKLKFDSSKNFETYVHPNDYKKVKFIMLIDYDITYGDKFEKKIAEQIKRYFL